MAYTSFYDQFDSPDVLRALVGVTPSGAGPKPDSMDSPGMTVMDRGAGPGPSYADLTARGGQAFPPGAPPPTPQGQMVAQDFQEGSGPLGRGGPPGAPPAGPSAGDLMSATHAWGQPSEAPPMAGAMAGGIWPGDPSAGAPRASPQPPNMAGGVWPGDPSNAPPTPMPPQRPQGAPLPPPPAAAIPPAAAPTAGGPPPMAPPGAPGAPPPGFGPGLPAMPQAQMGNRILGLFDRGALAAGMKAAGNSAGKSGFQAFASGAGAALGGAEGSDEKQFDRQMKVRKQAFDESNKAFSNMIAAANEKNTEKYRDSQGQFLAERAKLMAATARRGSNAWQITPQGQAAIIEREAQARYDRSLKSLEAQWKINGTPEAQQNAEKAAAAADREAYKQGRYKQVGMGTPEAQTRAKNQGMTADNPFTPKNERELHEMVQPAAPNPKYDPKNPEKEPKWIGGWFSNAATNGGKPIQFLPHKFNHELYGPKKNPDEGPAVTADDLEAMGGQ